MSSKDHRASLRRLDSMNVLIYARSWAPVCMR